VELNPTDNGPVQCNDTTRRGTNDHHQCSTHLLLYTPAPALDPLFFGRRSNNPRNLPSTVTPLTVRFLLTFCFLVSPYPPRVRSTILKTTPTAQFRLHIGPSFPTFPQCRTQTAGVLLDHLFLHFIHPFPYPLSRIITLQFLPLKLVRECCSGNLHVPRSYTQKFDGGASCRTGEHNEKYECPSRAYLRVTGSSDLTNGLGPSSSPGTDSYLKPNTRYRFPLFAVLSSISSARSEGACGLRVSTGTSIPIRVGKPACDVRWSGTRWTKPSSNRGSIRSTLTLLEYVLKY